MIAGQLRDRVTFQRRTTENVGGVGRDTWPDLPPARYPAAVDERQGQQESLIDGRVQTQTSRAYSVRCRYRPDVTTDDRAVYHHPAGDRVLQILGIAEDRTAHLLVLDCLEVRA